MKPPDNRCPAPYAQCTLTQGRDDDEGCRTSFDEEVRPASTKASADLRREAPCHIPG